MEAHYRALRRLNLGGDQYIMPGDLVPAEVRNREVLEAQGYVQRVYPSEPPEAPAPVPVSLEPVPPTLEDQPDVTAEAEEAEVPEEPTEGEEATEDEE